MKSYLLIFGVFGGIIFTPGRADSKLPLSADQLSLLDKRGYFSSDLKSAVHEMIDNQEALAQAKTEEASLKASLPALQQKVAEAQAKVTSQRHELAKYDHPDEIDFVDLQKVMKDDQAKPEDQLALAQAYVWTYPTNPHQAEAQQDVQQIQKKIADAVQAEKDREVAETARQTKLLERAKARDLTLDEWRLFLQDKSQQEVMEVMGQPSVSGSDYWTYDGVWTTDPATQKKVGIQITFNGGRVLTVAPLSP